jgi:hypothetical protein
MNAVCKMHRSAASILLFPLLCLGLAAGCGAEDPQPVQGDEALGVETAPVVGAGGAAALCASVPHASYMGHAPDCAAEATAASGACAAYCQAEGCSSNLLGHCIPDATSPDNYSYLCECTAYTCATMPRRSYVGHTDACDQTVAADTADCASYCAGAACASSLLGHCIPDATSPDNYSLLCACSPAPAGN